MDESNRDRIGHALEITVNGLQPFVAEVLEPHLASGRQWTDIVEALDVSKGIRGKIYRPNDLQSLLRVLTERLGQLGYPFTERLSRGSQTLASELRDVRNRWAHHDEFSDDDTYRAIDTAERLQRAIGRDDLGDLLALSKSGLIAPVAVPDVVPPETLSVGPAATVVATEAPDAGIASITIGLDAIPVLSYAAAHNRIGVINELLINNAGEGIRGAILRLEASADSGTLTVPSERIVDIGQNQQLVVRDEPLFLDPSALLQIEQRRPAWITASLELDGHIIATARVDVELLAAHQWVRRPHELATELLASYVQPNHPSIASLLVEASDHLLAKTGQSALNGYADGDNSPELIDSMAEAIFEAFKARDVRYALPPSSWGEGQIVRTPAEVLEGRLGTCLDTSVVFAAALEQAGLYSQIWITEGHAFVGYSRVLGFLPSAATLEVMEALNYLDLGEFGVIETTLLTDQTSTFAAARRRPIDDWLHGRPESVLGITDIQAARETRIFPLPSRTIGQDGTIAVSEYHPAARTIFEYPEYEKIAPGPSARKPIPYRVSQWKNALLDLTLRNKLINFTENGRIRLSVPADDAGYLEDLINASKPLTFIGSDEVPEISKQRGVRFGRDLPEAERRSLLRERGSAFADVTGAAYTSRFRGLAYRAKTIEEETGANNLYLAFGTLVWTLNARELESPLILVPVKLEPGRGGRYRVVLDESGTSTPNYCLLEKLRQVHGLAIPGLAEPTADGSGIDLDAAFKDTREALARAGLPFRVEATVDLSILQFTKFRLWKDLDENWESFDQNALVKHLIHTPTAPFVDPVTPSNDPDLDLLGALTPVPADSSQLKAIAGAVAGETFVLEGPPGTGKSQTITNLLVRAVAEGKKVLFVAEKRAALQVVQTRLEEVGLGAFSLDLHDKGSRPVAVRQQIKQTLAHRVAADPDGLKNALDAIDSAGRSLSRYASRLHELNDAGMSFYSSRTRLLASDPDAIEVEVPSSLVSGNGAERLVELRELLRDLPDVADPARPRPRHPWSFIDSAPADFDALLSTIKGLDLSIAALRSEPPIKAAFDEMVSSDDLERMAHILGATRFDRDEVDTAQSRAWSDSARESATRLDEFQTLALSEQFAGVDPTIVRIDLPAIHAEALAADQSRFFGRKRRRLAVRAQFERFLSLERIPKHRDVTATTTRLLELHQSHSALRRAFSAVSGLERSNEWDALAEDPAQLTYRIKLLSWVGARVGSEAAASDPIAKALRDLYFGTAENAGAAKDVDAVKSGFAAMNKLLTAESLESLAQLAAGESTLQYWRGSLSERDANGSGSATGRRWLELIVYVEPLRSAGLTVLRLLTVTGRLNPEAALAAFDRGLASTSLKERSTSTTLDQFSAATQNRSIERFTEASQTARNHLVTSVPHELLAKRSFDVDSISGQMGELKRQLDRQRGGMGVRSLLDRFGPLISELIPCMLMSPESVARFLRPDRTMFDIVVFDEASQVRVADAIGAIGRSKSVVVVGDSKQMPPTSFAETTTALEDAPERLVGQVKDEESILSECVAALVPSRALTWHYRSQDEVLIQFSNEHYYGNLSSFPSPLHASSDDGLDGHGISLVRVNGKFLRSGVGKALRTNPVEAEAIVDEVQRRFWASPDEFPSLGIVTFNAQQRSLIDSLLRDTEDERIVEALDTPSEGLFVKNLENVQGDERDTILFSTAFSANENGALPLNFGPVGMAGGERRLNVAITRARRQVILFSSFDPQDLRSESTSSIGLKHLRAYLELAASGGRSALRRPTRENTVDRHREEIAASLRLRGLHVTTDVGLSDFRVDLSVSREDEPDKPLVAILLDSPNWASRETVSDRDGLPISVLRDLMKWPGVERVWMPEWVANYHEVVERIVRVTDRAHEEGLLADLAIDGPLLERDQDVDSRSTLGSAENPRPDVRRLSLVAEPEDVQKIATASTRPRGADAPLFVAWEPRRVGSVSHLDRLNYGQVRVDVERLIREIVKVEGPIHVVRLAKTVAGAYGLDRVAQSRAQAIVNCIPRDLITAGDRTYVWPDGLEPEEWTLYRRTPDGVSRPLEHVHPREIANAMVALVRHSAGLYESDLRRETLHEFGLVRMTPNMTSALDRALKLGLDVGLLCREDAGLIVEGRRSPNAEFDREL